jgi:putative flippase GtrA
MNKQFARFLVAGGLAAGSNFGSRFVFSIFLPYSASIVFAYLVGMVVAFLLMRGHVFDARNGSVLPQVVKFTMINALAVLQTLVISLPLASWLSRWVSVDQSEALAHLIGVLVPVVTSYFGHKYLTFR